MMHCLFSLNYLNAFSLILAANLDSFSSEKYNYLEKNSLIFSPTVYTKLYHLCSGHMVLLLWLSLVIRGPLFDLGQCLHLNYWMIISLAYARTHCWLLASIPPTAFTLFCIILISRCAYYKNTCLYLKQIISWMHNSLPGITSFLRNTLQRRSS